MADFRLTFDCDGAAFEDKGVEVARILHSLADRIADMGNAVAGGTVRDINGNVVGRWSMAAREGGK